MLSKDFKDALRAPVDLKSFARPTSRKSSWSAQLRDLCFWFCAVTCVLFSGFQARLAFHASETLLDYGSLYASASLANQHVNPYRDHPLVFHLRDINRHGPDTRWQGTSVNAINLNPPVLLYPFRLLARLEPDASLAVWTWISVGLFICSVLIVVRMYPAEELRIRILWILALAAVWYTFSLGQIYTILMLCACIAWSALRKAKWLPAGIAIGVICAIKPNFFVWPGLLFLGRSKKVGVTAFATTAGLSGIPLLFQGPAIYKEWLAACGGYNGYELPGNASLLAMFSRAGLPSVGLILTVLMLAAVAAWVLLTKPESLFASEIGILAALLAGPISWIGYTLLLVPVLYGKSMNTRTRIACVLLCTPVWIAAAFATTTRLQYILLWAPHFYALVLLMLNAVFSGAFTEAAVGQAVGASAEEAASMHRIPPAQPSDLELTRYSPA